MCSIPMINDLEKWLLNRGNVSTKTGLPTCGLSPRTAKVKLGLIKKVLTELGYLTRGPQQFDEKGHPKEYVYTLVKNKKLNDLSVNELISYLDEAFPGGDQDYKTKALKRMYVFAIQSLCYYLHFEAKFRNKPVWSKAKLDRLKEKATYESRIKIPELDIIPPARIDPFIDYLKTKNRKHHMIAFLGRWCGGMRFIEAAHAKVSLDQKSGSTLIIDFRKKTVKIWGKGRGGLGKDRSLPLSDKVEAEIKDYLKWRKRYAKDNDITSDWLIPTDKDQKYTNSGMFNQYLRGHAKTYGKFQSHDIKLIKSHSIGRHAFGTYYAKKLPVKTLMEFMGIEDFETVKRYINFGMDEKRNMLNEADKTNTPLEEKQTREGPPASSLSQPSEISPEDWAEFQEFKKFKAMMELKNKKPKGPEGMFQ